MLKKWLAVILMFLLITSFVTVKAQEQFSTSPKSTAPPVDQLIVQFVEETDGLRFAADALSSRVQQLSDTAGVSLQYVRPMSGEAHVLALPGQMSAKEAQVIAARLNGRDDVAYAEPDYIRQIAVPASLPDAAPTTPLLTPNDTYYGNQWHYEYVAGSSEGLNLPAAWNINTGSSSVVVAVLDTGILNHADLSGRTVSGYDFISDTFTANDGDGRDADPSDPGDWTEANECGFPHSARSSSWHGTHVAGTIGAATNNSIGVAGVDWNARILPVRVLGKCGGYTSDIVDGMRWAAGLSVSGAPANANPADVLNLSLGGFGNCSTSEQNAINAITAAGGTVVVAAGNENGDAANYTPASCNGVITVAANDREGNRASYSNYGNVVEVTAPGGETATPSNGVLSTLDSGATTPNNDNVYAYYQGTSMATPHVSGLISLILAEYPSLSPTRIVSHLQITARPFPAGSNCNTANCGAGIVDAYNALATAPVTFNESAHLPLVMSIFGSTAENPFVNPDFESGRTGWTEFSTHGWDIIGTTFPGTVTPHSGTWAAWLGGDDDDISYIKQRVTVPAGAPHLTYWHWIASEDVCGFDLGGVIVNDSDVVDVYDLCDARSTGGWVRHSVNLSAYAGQSVTIQIRAETDGSLNSNLFVDDVSFQASPSSATAPPAPSSHQNALGREDVQP